MTHWVGEEKWVEIIGVEWGAGGGVLEKDGAVVDGNESGTVKTVSVPLTLINLFISIPFI